MAGGGGGRLWYRDRAATAVRRGYHDPRQSVVWFAFIKGGDCYSREGDEGDAHQTRNGRYERL